MKNILSIFFLQRMVKKSWCIALFFSPLHGITCIDKSSMKYADSCSSFTLLHPEYSYSNEQANSCVPHGSQSKKMEHLPEIIALKNRLTLTQDEYRNSINMLYAIYNMDNNEDLWYSTVKKELLNCFNYTLLYADTALKKHYARMESRRKVCADLMYLLEADIREWQQVWYKGSPIQKQLQKEHEELFAVLQQPISVSYEDDFTELLKEILYQSFFIIHDLNHAGMVAKAATLIDLTYTLIDFEYSRSVQNGNIMSDNSVELINSLKSYLYYTVESPSTNMINIQLSTGDDLSDIAQCMKTINDVLINAQENLNPKKRIAKKQAFPSVMIAQYEMVSSIQLLISVLIEAYGM